MFTSYNISSVIVRKKYLLTGQIDKVTSVLTSIFVELNLNSQNIYFLCFSCVVPSHTTTPSSYCLHPLLSAFSPVNARNLPQLSLPLLFFFFLSAILVV